MDVSYTSEFDAARYGRLIGRMLGLVGYGNSPWTWGVMIAGVSQVFVRRSVRCFDTHVRLFDLIHGENDPRRPVFGDSLRAKVTHFLANAGEADEYLYVFVPDEEDDKVGLYARYGGWSCEAYFPCGCACSQNPGYFDHIKALHKPTVYYESEKAVWLEKIRPIAKDLYESEDEDDDREI